MARSFINATENNVLNWLFGTSAYTPHPSNLKLALSLVLVDELGNYNQLGMAAAGYLDQAIAFGAASSGVVGNTGTIAFPTATAPWGKIVGWLVYDGTSFDSIASGYMATYFDNVYVVDVANSRVSVVGATAPANDQRVGFGRDDPDGGALSASPSIGLFEDGIEYWVVNSGAVSADTFQIALTRGGAPVAFSGSDPRLHAHPIFISKTVTVNAGDTLVFPAGSISISLK